MALPLNDWKLLLSSVLFSDGINSASILSFVRSRKYKLCRGWMYETCNCEEYVPSSNSTKLIQLITKTFIGGHVKVRQSGKASAPRRRGLSVRLSKLRDHMAKMASRHGS
eukprot:scaffold37052_cov46-Cyclotella_meneghiniana.AAC.4